MAKLQDRFSQSGATARTGAAVDEGLLAPTCSSVYNYMSAGVALTGIAAYAVSALAWPAKSVAMSR